MCYHNISERGEVLFVIDDLPVWFVGYDINAVACLFLLLCEKLRKPLNRLPGITAPEGLFGELISTAFVCTLMADLSLSKSIWNVSVSAGITVSLHPAPSAYT